ncbi:MAG TPA: DUF1330 domain-containing protein [Hydrogenophaga sp.]|uniref:DUF1330 domain-containing protein n=1 Tax=Hydrogenophaga sp. TaxID=1904254 RepID=UPI002BD87775|nr:DUF1330 domain-containing protein [Hydrogenophaga sp.]HMN92054.1 DUF1330 domain-containing protein [Hydrogenophaga sp.]HMP11896.1 DUF1330 domain-containing protein [Hydrogenophaga sp.]
MSSSTHVLSDGQLQVLDALPPDQPVVMLNLLRFHDQAVYADTDQAEPCSGREAYKRYSQTSLQTIAAVGGRVIFGGKAHEALIGAQEERWHQAFLVQYPSPAAFRAMVAMPQYQACVHHRTAALADSRLIPLSAFQAQP